MTNLLTLLGRIAIAHIFLISGIKKMLSFSETAEKMAGKGIQPSEFFLAGTITFLILGSLSLIAGYKTRWGAILLLIFIIPVTIIYHLDPSSSSQMGQFRKNIGLLGGLLMVLAYGAGGWSIDAKSSKDRSSLPSTGSEK